MRNERGAILILSFMVLIAMTSLVSSYLYVTGAVTKSAGFGEVDDQAFWLAEAGLQKAFWKLSTDSGFRSSPSNLAGNAGAGSYSVTTTRSAGTYTVSSTGTIGGVKRKVTQDVIVTPAAFDYAIFGDTNVKTLKIEDSAVISGDVFYDGNVQISSPASVTNGLVYADSVSGDGTYTAAGGDPNPVPDYPSFDTTTYDNHITNAENSNPNDLTLTGSTTLTLSGTQYYKAITIKNSATLTGTATVVATDDVTLENSGTISSNIQLIAKKKITIKNTATVTGSSTALMYAREGITLENSASMTAGNILVPTNGKEVELKNEATMNGAIYADKVTLQNEASVTGSVVAREYKSDKIGNSVRVTYDDSKLGDMPEGMHANAVTLRVQKDWAEVQP